MLTAALQLAELGYAVFPCAPNAKRPATGNGLLDATTDAEQIERWWTQTPTANIGVRTDGLLVVDVDGAENPWLADQPDKLLELAAAPLSQTPRGGKHFIFKQPQGKAYRNTAGKLAPAVDTRAAGGYILVDPSIVDGKPYRWQSALDVAPAQLPEPPTWLLALLDAPAAAAPASVRAADTRPANPIPDGQRNSTLTSLGGTMRRVGMGYDEILAALKTTNAQRCRPPLDDVEVGMIAASVARYEPDEKATGLAEGSLLPEPLKSAPRVGPFPKDLLAVPGFVGDVCRHNLAGAYKPQPVLALAGALSLLATLTGRKITDPYGTRTNLYILGVGESGCGKERAREVNKEIAFEAGLAKLLGPEGIASHAGLVTAVEQQPAILFQLDEIGRILKTMAAPNAAPHLFGIVTVLMRLYSSSKSVYLSDAYADKQKNKAIDQPHACLYGTTVPKSLYEGLTADNLTDGFVSRLLIFETTDADPEPQLGATSLALPAAVVDAAKHWGAVQMFGNLTSEHPKPRVVPYTDDAAAALVDLEALARRERLSGSSIAALWTRTTEKARKLALLWACSADAVNPVVSAEAAYWAARLSEYLTRRLVEIGADHVAENPFEASRKRVLRVLRDAGDGLSLTGLTRATRHLRGRDRQEIIDSLLAAGEISEERVDTGGRAKLMYRAC